MNPYFNSIFVLMLLVPAFAVASECEPLLGSTFTVADLGELFVPSSHFRDASRNVHVTGARQFPLAMVRRALDLDAFEFAGQRVLSVGEGWSPLTAYVRGLGAWTIATDLWYGVTSYPNTATGRELATFEDQHRPHLAAARGTALPFRDGSFDVVLSNFVIQHLRMDEAVGFLEQVAGVLAPGGQAVITQPGFDEDARVELEDIADLALRPDDYDRRITEDEVPVLNLYTNEVMTVPILRLNVTRTR